jgi:hypothetical protein
VFCSYCPIECFASEKHREKNAAGEPAPLTRGAQNDLGPFVALSCNHALQKIAGKLRGIPATGALPRLCNLRAILEPTLRNGLKAGQLVAISQRRCERGGIAHRNRDLGNQSVSSKAMRLACQSAPPIVSANLQQAERRRSRIASGC